MRKAINTEETKMKKAQTSKNGREMKQQYTISVRKKGKGFDSRVTLKVIDDGKNPRMSAYGTSQDESVFKLLQKMETRLIEYKKMGLLNNHLTLKIYDSVLASVKNLGITNNEVLQKVSSLLNELTQDMDIENNAVENNSKPVMGAKETIKKVDDFINNHIEKAIQRPFKDVGLEWFEYKKSFLIQTPENPNPLSPKTIEGYHHILFNQVIPYFEKNENITLITEDDLKSCVLSFNGYRSKESAYVVLKMVMDYAREKHYIATRLTIKKPKRPTSTEEEEIIFIEVDRQNVWLDKFEEENTDVSLLFETMLLTGCRPEEACGLKWESVKFDTDEILIRNAFKDVPVYNDEGKIIGHIRQDDRLKTPESYRTIPLNPRLKKVLEQHKENQQKLFKMFRLKWNEKSYCFINQYRRPFVADNLSKSMPRFYEKYSLEYMTPYGLRHSFATFCSEMGMEQIVLMKLMGHSDFNTTLKYYISVSKKRKQKAMAEAYKDIFKVKIAK